MRSGDDDNDGLGVCWIRVKVLMDIEITLYPGEIYEAQDRSESTVFHVLASGFPKLKRLNLMVRNSAGRL
jgi:hypothetical protein